MKDKKKQAKFIDAKRRGFMQGAAVAGAGVATGVATSTANAADIDLVKPDADGNKLDRYEENDYVRAYYKNARF